MNDRLAHLIWKKGGDAVIVRTSGDAVTLSSTIPSPPGSRLEGTLLAIAPSKSVRVKVHTAKKDDDERFTIEGRFIDLSRDIREAIEAHLRASSTDSANAVRSDSASE